LSLALSEDTIHNIVPSIDKQIAKRLAYIIASSKEFNSCTNESSEDITVRIKRICKKIIESVIAKRNKGNKGNKGKMRRRKTKDSLDDSETAKTLLLLHRSPSNVGKKQLTTKTKDRRYNMLIHVVGVEMFNEIMSVSQEIRNIRQHSKLWSRFSPRCNVSRSTSSITSLGDVVDDDYHCKMIEYEEKHDLGTKEEEEHLPASQALPLPIADIYFHTRLVNVIHIIDSGSCKQCIPIEELSTKEEQKRQQHNGCIVYQTNWQELLLDAKTKLEAFHTFQRKELSFI